jgi:hypothetical protein
MKMPQSIGLGAFHRHRRHRHERHRRGVAQSRLPVQGSDQADSANVQRLRDKGIECFVGHRPRTLATPRWSSCRPRSRSPIPSCMAAREKLLPIVRRAEMLAELMRFRHCNRHRRHAWQDHDDDDGGDAARCRRARPDRHQWRHHQRLRHQCAHGRRRVDGGRGRRERRHLPQAAGRRRRRHQYRSRAPRPLRRLRQGARGVPAVRRERAVLRLWRDVHRPSGGAGAGRPHRGSPRHHLWREPAGRRAVHQSPHGTAVQRSSTSIRNRKTAPTRIEGLRLPMPGRHNVSNATAAIAVAIELGLSAEAIRKGLSPPSAASSAASPDRHLERGDVFDDYGHHPVEIKAVLRAARESDRGQVIAITQPHRFTRLRDLFDDFATCFNDADTVMSRPSTRRARTRSKASTRKP